MEQILITRANATVELINSSATITSIVSAEHRKSALGEDVVVMDVETAVDRAFGIGDSIKLFGGNTYKINQLPEAEKISERKFRYNLVFEGIQYDLLRVLYRNEDVSSFSTSAEFALTGNIEMFLNVLINNANRTFGANKWALGEFPADTETKNLLFSNENCLTVLQRICSEYSYEFTFTETSTQKILNVKRLGSELDFTFEYGKAKGLYNLKRNSVDSKKIINKLFVYGSTKNIPANYKNYSQRLHFGTVSPFTESVVTDEDSIASFGVCEGSVIFDDVFPTGYNSITAINTSNRLEFTDSSMSFDLNAKDGSGNTLYLIPGVTAKVHFNSGNLAGYEFEIEKYTHSTKKFIIKAVDDGKGLKFPSSTESAFQFAVGDTYSLLDIVMPQSLIDAAESLLQSKGFDYLNENKAPIVKYTVAIDEAYLKSKTSELNIFDVGDSVVVKDSDFNVNTRIKIVSFTRNVLRPYSYSIVVSDVTEISALRALTIKANDTQRINRHNGFNEPIKFKQNPDSNPQIQSQIDETINRKPSVLIGRDSNNLTLGNKENQTLVELLGGKLKIGDSNLYSYKIEQGDGNIYSYLGIENDLQVDGRIGAVGGIEVGMGGVLITKEVNADNIPYGQITAENYIDVVTPVINFPNTINVNTIGATGSSIAVDSPVYFNQAIYIQPSENPNSPITNQQFDVALAAYDFGNIRIYSPVRAASNGSNVTLFGEYLLDSVNLVDGDKVLVKDQTDATENYIYIVKNGATWEKVTDLPNGTIKGIQVQVTEGGLVNKGGLFINTNATDVTVGVTEITFRQSYQNVLNPYAASLAADNQVFDGTNRFANKLEVRTPLTGTEAANMDYVIAKVGELNTTVVNGYWPKKNNYGIGTTTNNALEFYANNVKEAQINVGGRMTGLKGLHINDDVFTPPFATSGTDLANYYGITVRDNVHIGALGGLSRELYSLDFVRGSNTGSRAGLRFGNYISSGGVSNFYYGIEYSTGEKLSIGRYSSSAMDGTGVAFDSSKITTYDSSGNWAFGKSNASYRVDVNGDVNISGMFRLNGSFGADHTFLKSNGTTQEFAPMNVGEIEDIYDLFASKSFLSTNHYTKTESDLNFVKRVTDNGERGFFLYGDTDNTAKEAFVFTNPDTGIVGIHAFRLNDTTVEQFGFQLDKNGLPYWLFTDGSRKRILTENDVVSGGGSIVYTLAEPLYFSGTQINVRTASASQIGVLTSSKFSEFDAKLGQGSTVSTFLNYGANSVIYFERVGDTTESAGKISVYNYNGGADKDLVLNAKGVGADIFLLCDGAVFARSSSITNPLVMGVEVDFGANADNSILKFNGTNINWKLNTTPTNGQKFLVQYDSSKSTFFFVPA